MDASAAAAAAAQDEDLRLKIRYGMEELLERVLSKLQVPGALSHAAIIALEFEEELCRKYTSGAENKAGVGDKKPSTGVLDKKEYRKHYLMLNSNLRKTHNEPLVSDYAKLRLQINVVQVNLIENFMLVLLIFLHRY